MERIFHAAFKQTILIQFSNDISAIMNESKRLHAPWSFLLLQGVYNGMYYTNTVWDELGSCKQVS